MAEKKVEMAKRDPLPAIGRHGADDRPPGSPPEGGRAPLWVTLGLAVVVFVMNVLIFAYAATDGLPRASEPHGAAHGTAAGAGAGNHQQP